MVKESRQKASERNRQIRGYIEKENNGEMEKKMVGGSRQR